LHIEALYLDKIWIITFYIEAVEQIDQMLNIWIFFKQLLKNRAVYHMIYDPYKEILLLLK